MENNIKDIAAKKTRADLIESGVIRVSEQLIKTMCNIVDSRKLTIELIAAHADRLNDMLQMYVAARDEADAAVSNKESA